MRQINETRVPGITFPMCNWYGHRIVHNLPMGCPMRAQDPLSALAQLQRQAWAVVGEGFDTSDLADGLHVLDQGRVCGDCIPRTLSHSIVRRLRRRKGAA